MCCSTRSRSAAGPVAPVLRRSSTRGGCQPHRDPNAALPAGRRASSDALRRLAFVLPSFSAGLQVFSAPQRLAARRVRTGFAHVRSGKRQQRDVTRPLQRGRQGALVLGAGTGLPSGLNLAALRNVALEPPKILVVDRVHLVHAELADLTPRNKSAPSPRRRGPRPGRPARTSHRWFGSAARCRLVLHRHVAIPHSGARWGAHRTV
jgi:hypothetical protein